MKTPVMQFLAKRSPHKRYEALCFNDSSKKRSSFQTLKLPLILIMVPNNKTKQNPYPKSRGQNMTIVQTKHLPKSDMILTLPADHTHEYSQLVRLLVFLPLLLQVSS